MTFERLGTRVAELVVRFRWLTIALCVLVGAGFVSGIRFARFSTDYRVFFSSDDARLEAFVALEDKFSKTDNVLFVVHPREGDVFSNDALAAVQELTEAGWLLPYAGRVDSPTNFQHARAVEDDLEVGNLVAKPAADLTPDDLQAIRVAAAGEAVLVGSLLAKDQRTAGVNVTLRLPGADAREVTETADAARRVLADVSARHPALDVRLSGMALMNEAFMQASVRDLAVMLPLMLAVVLLAMALLTRSLYGTLAVGFVLLLTAGMSMAVAGWMHYPLTPPSVAAPMIVLTVAVADGVHLVLAVMRNLRGGLSQRAAIVRAVAENLQAITYAWLTTVVGFASLNFSEAPPVLHLANMTCVGVTAAFAFSIVLLPAMLALLPMRAPVDHGGEARSGARYATLVHWVVRWRREVLVGTAALTLLGGVAASRLETNDQFVQYFSPSLAFRRDVDFTMEHLSGIYRVEFRVESGEPGGVTEPAYLEHLDQLATWLRAQPETQHVYSFTDVVGPVHRLLHPGTSERLPTTRDGAAQSLLLYEFGLPAGLEMTDRVDVARSASRLTVTVRDLSTKQMRAFTRRAEEWMTTSLPPAMWSKATGPVVIFSELGDRNATNMVKADALSLLLISLCMIVVLRSWKLGLLSVVPNVVPIVIGYGVWQLIVGQMNVVATVAATISLGIIVDDTIHFLTRYRASAERLGPRATREDVLADTLAHVGPAMASTTVILLAGFGVLTLSSFQMTSYLGWLSVLIIGVALLCDLIIAPALVCVFLGNRVAPRAAASSVHLDPHSGAAS